MVSSAIFQERSLTQGLHTILPSAASQRTPSAAAIRPHTKSLPPAHVAARAGLDADGIHIPRAGALPFVFECGAFAGRTRDEGNANIFDVILTDEQLKKLGLK
jgi:hypothetical protein